jgi:glutamate/tyrosine decarboxylase-like PLP-dependent enzyme
MTEINSATGATKMRDILESNGTRATSLDLTDEALQELAGRAVQLVTDYFQGIGELPVFTQTGAAELTAQFTAPLPSAPAALDQLFDDCRRLFAGSRHNGHPRFFGYIASPATPVGAFADLIASALNQNVPAWRSAPAATQIEHTVVAWLASMIDYEGAGGLLTSGGSMANLNALYVAQRTVSRTQSPSDKIGSPDLDVSQTGLWGAPRRMTLYISDQAHLSLAKTWDILGCGREQVRVVGTDEGFRMDMRDLRAKIERDLREGFRPCCVVGTAGTVNTGAIDPLAEIARVARDHDLWFHIDGAYGALATLDPAKRPLFAGMKQADSIALDPHKWLYAPVDAGCLLFRDPTQAHAAWTGGAADYIKILEETETESFAFFDYGPELSRRFRALKIWMMLRYYGLERVAAAISEDNALASYFGATVEAATDFELLAPVGLSVCCFRFVPPEAGEARAKADAAERAQLDLRLNELNQRILRAVQRGGRAYISNANLRGRFALRACIVNFRTTRRDIDDTLEIIREAARPISFPQITVDTLASG